MDNFWKDFQSFVNCCIPTILIDILTKSGYNDPISLSGMNEEEIQRLEMFVNDNLHTLFEQYSCLKPFAFLPGHRKLLICIGNEAEKFQQHLQRKTTINPSIDSGWNPSNTTFLMNELIKSVQRNLKNSPT